MIFRGTSWISSEVDLIFAISLLFAAHELPYVYCK